MRRPSTRQVPDALGRTQRCEKVEIEGERLLNVGDGKIDVVDSSRWHAPPALLP
jgi:hypothetical protein